MAVRTAAHTACIARVSRTGVAQLTFDYIHNFDLIGSGRVLQIRLSVT